MRRKKVGKFLMAMVIGVFLLAGYSNHKSAKTQKNITIMTQGDLQSLDTTAVADIPMWDMLTQTSEGLYRVDAHNKVVPAIAAKKVQPTNNGKSYTFKLRENAKWNNGQQVTAKDFVTAWRRSLDPKATAGYSFIFAPIKNAREISAGQKSVQTLGATATDSKTLKIELTWAVPYFDKLLTLPIFFPQNTNYIKRYGSKYATNSATFSSNGPFMIQGWKGNNKSWNLTKNKYYYGKKDIKLNKINVQVVQDSNTAYNLYKTKKLNVARVTGSTAKGLHKDSDLKRNPIARTYYISFNMSGKSPFRNLKVRQALNLALDRKRLTDNVISDGSKPAYTFAGKGLAIDPTTNKDFGSETSVSTKRDLTKAKKLWNEGIKEEGLGGKRVNISLVAYNEIITKQVTEYLQSVIEDNFLHTSVTVNNAIPKVWINKVNSGDFGINYVFWNPDYSDPMSNLENFTTGNPKNYGKYNDAYYNQQLDDARYKNANSPAKYWANMRNAEKRLNDTLPLIPIYNQTESYLVSPKLKGVAYHTVGQNDYTRAYLK